MGKRTLCFDWSSLVGARKKKRKLYFEADEKDIFVCPIPTCLHEGFKSKRGLRKHVNNQHEWYLYFDIQPSVKREDAQPRPPSRRKADTQRYPSFAVNCGYGAEFATWLQTPCGGGKSAKDAKQISTRAMKFLMFCAGDSEDGLCAPESYIDCCIGSPTMLMKFLQLMVEEWGLKAAGSLSYIHAITDLLDHRKCQGVPDASLRLFAVTEVYLRRSKTTLYKKRHLEYSRDLSLEALMAKGSWASLDEIEQVIPHHSPRYEQLYKQASDSKADRLSVSDLAFASRFIISFLLLRVKCTRPMSLQFLTIQMVDQATKNGGYVDQSKFKTSAQFAFDTLKFTEPALEILNGYCARIRPLCKPSCDYVFVTTSGTQYTAFSNAHSMLTFDAINKHITPTRLRAIIETASIERLEPEKQAIISQDQKHSSHVARRCYQKKLSRTVATDGAEAMKELLGSKRDIHTDVLADSLRVSAATPSHTDDGSATQSDAVTVLDESLVSDDASGTETTRSEPITVEEVGESTGNRESPTDIAESSVEVKKEEVKNGKRFLTFTNEEDKFIRLGVVKYADSGKKWSDILHNKEYVFQPGRTRDSLRVRAASLGLGKMKTRGKGKP